ncbi:MAG: hypothetical protein Q8O53_00610, partial [Candidatus Moranbacteria bacterium]|nr:hypothetical protein [Candidatus Moranbacteria bacterium]
MRKIIIILGGILIVGLIAVGLYFFWPTLSPPGGLFQNNATSATVPVEQGAISQTVMVNNAKLVAREEFDLSFPFPGRIKSLSTQEGLVVSDKSELVQLDPVELELERQKTQAAFKQSVSNFNKIKVGTSNFELKIFSNVVEGSKTTLANSKRILIDAIRASYATADDSVRDAADQMITNPRSATPQLTFSITDSDLKSEIESARKDLEESLADWEDGVNKLDPSDNLTKANRTAEKKLNATRKFLDDLAYAVNGITAGGGITQETLTAWQLYVATARASLATMKS